MKLLRMKEVRQRTGLSRSSIYLLESQQRFPRRLKPTPGTSAWLEDEIQAWIADRVRDRDSGTSTDSRVRVESHRARARNS